VTLRIFDNMEQRSEAWYAARCGIVTASVVGKLLTPTLKVADNDTSRAITAVLAAERITGWTEDTPMSSDMWRGVEHEPIARDIYSRHHAEAIETGFMVRREFTWTLGYSPDGLVGDDGLLEIKCPRAKTHLNTILADQVPPMYMPQLQAGLLVSGRDWIDFVSFVGGMRLYTKRVYPDPRWHDAIVAAVEKFEYAADEMVTAYREATAGLPATERVTELEMVI
jgi:putative phage-type endonuclease